MNYIYRTALFNATVNVYVSLLGNSSLWSIISDESISGKIGYVET